MPGERSYVCARCAIHGHSVLWTYCPECAKARMADLCLVCHEDMGNGPCDKPAVGQRIDPNHGGEYPVCVEHLRPPWPNHPMVPAWTMAFSESSSPQWVNVFDAAQPRLDNSGLPGWFEAKQVERLTPVRPVGTDKHGTPVVVL